MTLFDLTGRVAVITGGNGGVGLGIAQALAGQGCNVSIWGRNADKNKAAAARLADLSGNVEKFVANVMPRIPMRRSARHPISAALRCI